MPCLLAALALARQNTPRININEGLAISGVVAGGRNPVPEDAVLAKLAQDPSYVPHLGETLQLHGRSAQKWHEVKANKDGVFEGQNSYICATVESTADGTMLLNAAGDGFVYVNGEIRGGDPYSYGYLNLPVKVHKGSNTLLFSVGRGSLKASLAQPRAICQIETQDTTLPDILTTDRGTLFGALEVLNNTDHWVRGLTLVTSGRRRVVTNMPPLMPLSLRKVRFDFPVDAGPKCEVSLYDGRLLLDKETIDLGAVKQPNQNHKRTFVSGIDGTVQYYAVNPAQKPSPSNALVLTLHGASVEAIGQDNAYTNKDWVTLVAPTNRRPYGFDWEDVGREDALEVLAIAKRTFPHDPTRVFLTGHSMGGHGTWAVGTMYPDQFGVVAPSAGWISFWSYGGGWQPRDATPEETLLRRSMNAGDTLLRLHNTASEALYVLHGDADDNVPVEQARTMKRLLQPWHPDFTYHEQPGAGHWWGNQCVDWPPIFEEFKTRHLNLNPDELDFTTVDPAISAHDRWATIDQQQIPLEPSRIALKRVMGADSVAISGTTENVKTLSLVLPRNRTLRLQLNGSESDWPIGDSGQITLRLTGSHWDPASISTGEKNAERGGPIKQVLANRFVLVYGTHGSPEMTSWAISKARYDQETFTYRGNGSPDVMSDDEFFRTERGQERNAIFYGTPPAGRLSGLLQTLPRSDSPSLAGGETGILCLRPRTGTQRALIAYMIPTGPATERILERLPFFTSGVAYPDWMILGANAAEAGTKAIVSDGFFDNRWQVSKPDSAFERSAANGR